jgi:hypothetical protein
MTGRRVRNVAAAHRAKLLALAHERGEDFQFLLSRWVVERFLSRLAASGQKDRFILKGATLFLAWEGRLHRPTRDLDLLGFGSPEVMEVVQRIQDVCATRAADGLIFELKGIQGERIREDAEYEGVRVRVPVTLDGARVMMQIDIGFGDLVDPPPMEVTLPALLPLDAPVLRGYPREVVIAEKFHAMVVLGIANSRMKDFFDIWTLASTQRFDLERLSQAIRSTFERRRTGLPERTPVALTAEFLGDGAKQKQWLAFGLRLGLKELPSLPVVGEQISDLLLPAIQTPHLGHAAGKTWKPGGPWGKALLDE